MSHARYLVGDVFDRMAELPDASVDLVLTSPPFLALRSYLPADHPDKAKEIGSEPTPAAFLDTLLHLTAEWRRVLAPHGSICVELGDTYAGSGGSGGDYLPGGLRDGQPPAAGSAKWDRSSGRRAPGGQPYTDTFKGGGPGGNGWPMDKSLCGIPHLYHLSLAYGRNLLTGEPSPAGQWRVRNVVAWCRPNPPVGALGDKFRPGTSYMTVACVARDRYFDLDAVRQPFATEHGDPERSRGHRGKGRIGGDGDNGHANNPAGAPPLDWWEIPTAPYAGSHYATWPPALCTRPIRAMCPQKVCTVCGQPSRRIVGDAEYVKSAHYTGLGRRKPHHTGDTDDPSKMSLGQDGSFIRSAPTLGWTDCGCSSGGSHWRTGIVLDPFAGSGTTLSVATGEGRDAIGIDLDARNADLARERVGMFLDVEDEQPRPIIDVELPA